MKQLLKIQKPSSNTFIIWEHILKSVVFFVGTFALLFFGPLMLGAKSRWKNGENSFNMNIIEFLLTHPIVYFGASVIAVILCNLYIFVKNKKMKYVVGVKIDNDIIEICLTNLYFSQERKVELSLSDFELNIEQRETEFKEKNQTLIFKNSKTKDIIGKINPKQAIWEDKLIEVKSMLVELKQFRA